MQSLDNPSGAEAQLFYGSYRSAEALRHPKAQFSSIKL
jgi:hypothetical protein